MAKYTRGRLARLIISVSILSSIKLQEPKVSYLQLLTAAPVAYAVAEKVVGERGNQK